MRGDLAGGPLQHLHQRHDQPTLGNHGHHHPFQQVALDSQEVSLGGQIGIEQVDLLIRKGLGLFFRKAAGCQFLTNRWVSKAIASLMPRL